MAEAATTSMVPLAIPDFSTSFHSHPPIRIARRTSCPNPIQHRSSSQNCRGFTGQRHGAETSHTSQHYLQHKTQGIGSKVATHEKGPCSPYPPQRSRPVNPTLLGERCRVQPYQVGPMTRDSDRKGTTFGDEAPG